MDNQNLYTRKQVVEICQPNPNWMNFKDEVIYEKETISFEKFIHEYHTVFDDVIDFERPTIAEYAEYFLENIVDITDEKRKKITDMVNTISDDYEYSVPAFIALDLKKLLPEEYPSYISLPDNDYVIEDGNHRSIALAIKYLNEGFEGKDVVVYKGRLV